MATLRQIEASRSNGAKSHGPVTPEGKARTKFNSQKHGIYSKSVLLHNEDPEAYALTLGNALADWEPATNTERRLVTDIVNAEWRIDRLTALESAALDLETDRMRPDVDEMFEDIDEATRTTLAFNSVITNNQTFQVIQSTLRSQYRIRDRAIVLLLRLQKERRAAEVQPQSAPVVGEPEVSPTPAAGTPSRKPATPAPRPSPAAVTNIENHRNEPGPSRPQATTPSGSPPRQGKLTPSC